jgi:predicted Mrr-cat superfamily restriction endonuclease
MNEQPKVYLAQAGKNGEDEEYALENGLAIIGFQEVPSLEARRTMRRSSNW